MPLRNGKQYLDSYLCRRCKEFYGSDDYDFKCSACFNRVSGQLSTYEAYIESCNNWATENCLVSTDSSFQPLKRISKLKNDLLLYNCLRMIKHADNKFLLAKDALKLFKDNPTLKRGHILGHMIGDWWRIISGENKWPAYVSCYYGNYNEPHTFSTIVPPRMPHSLQMKLCK